jgi:hypothetical protein
MRRRTVLKVTALAFSLAAALLAWAPGGGRALVFRLVKEASCAQALFATRHLTSFSSEHFVVRCAPENSAGARLVLDAAEKAYNQLAAKYDFQGRRIPVIIYPSRQELNRYFGWPAGESAMGAYWAGVIRVLAPEAWISGETGEAGEEGEKLVFERSGPMLHEFTHLVVDSLTNGNVPRWLTEGLAQDEELRVNGFTLPAPANLGARHYSFSALDRGFDALPDQTLAYGQSLSAVKYIAAVYGEGKIREILAALGAGRDIDGALTAALGVNLEEFENGWKNWAGQNG